MRDICFNMCLIISAMAVMGAIGGWMGFFSSIAFNFLVSILWESRAR